MSKIAYIHSLHSQVPSTIRKLDDFYELIVSMDSHLDLQLGLDIDFYPEQLRQIAKRTSAHTEIRRITGDFPLIGHVEGIGSDFIIVISKRCFEQHVSVLPLPYEFSDIGIDQYESFINTYFNVDIYQNPPRGLKGLISVANTYDCVLLDIDIDYIKECQGECYTPVVHEPIPIALETIVQVLRFIKKAKPPVITLSEAKLSAMRNPNSMFNSLLDKLRKFGYEVITAELVDNDEQVIKGIKDNTLFHSSWTKFKDEHDLIDLDKIEESFTSSLKIEEEFARRFFKDLGY